MSSDSDDTQDSKGINDHIITNGNLSTHPNGNGGSPMTDDDDVPLAKSELVSPAIRTLKRKKPVNYEESSSDDAPLASSPGRVNSAARNAGAPQTTNGSTATDEGRKSKRKSDNDGHGDSDDEFEEEKPLDKKPKNATPNGNAKEKVKPPPKKRSKKEEDSDSGSDDNKQKVQRITRVPTKRLAAEDDESGEDNKPAVKKATKSASRKKAKKEENASDLETSKPKKSGKVKNQESTGGSPRKEKGKKKKEEEPEDVFRWWDAQDVEGGDSIKWQTLEHNGVIFPPPYEPLPMNVKMKYKGKSIDLPPAAEEVAGFYAAMLETDHAQDKTFNKNFFEDWLAVLKKNPPLDGTRITSFDLCDFRPMFEHFESEKAKKKALTAAEKKEIKKAKDEAEVKYVTCLLDGRKEKIGNFRVEPPGLFRGRGDHPKKGALKLRVRPEDITINIGKGVPVPVPNMPGTWKNVIHDQTVTWLATWTENINGNHKYVFLAAGSSLKGQSDMSKFEKARELKNHVERIREEYTNDLRNKVMADRMRATAMYFIDRLALRAGNEKGEDEADTVGCCSLRCEHVTLEAPNFIIFDFLGKDSIRYYNRVAVDPQVFKNVRIFKENKNDDDSLFDRVNTSILNKHLNSKMKGLSAKVFRTYNASITFQEQLDNNTPDKATVQEKLNAYNQANRMVAILCNHQRSIPKTHEQSMEKMRYRLLGLKYDRMKLRHVLFKTNPKYRTKKQYSENESDIDEEWIEAHEEQLKAKDIEKAEKKFAKENEKLVAEGQKEQKDSVLKEAIKDIEKEYERLELERGTGEASLRRERPIEKIEEAISKLDDKIKAFKLQIEDRDAGKEVALGTSKINYLDPRITAAWCKIHDVPIEKIFNKSLLVKFPWAMEVDNDWKF